MGIHEFCNNEFYNTLLFEKWVSGVKCNFPEKNGTYRAGKKFMFLVSNKDGCCEITTLCNNLRVSCGFFYLEIKQMYNVE